MLVLRIRGGRVNHLFLAQERSKGFPLLESFRVRTATIRAKAKVNHSKMGDTSGLLASLGRGPVTIVTSLYT